MNQQIFIGSIVYHKHEYPYFKKALNLPVKIRHYQASGGFFKKEGMPP
jgi:hypothetical protein